MPIHVVEQVAGLGLLTLILLDILVTVLYARAGSGLIAPHLERGFWRLIRRISTISRRRREQILSFGGPLMVVAVVAIWFVGLSLAAALVIHPALGSSLKVARLANFLGYTPQQIDISIERMAHARSTP